MRRWLRVCRLRLRSLFVRDAVEDELDEELRYHLERQIDDCLARGMAPGEARLAALKAMGGLEQRKEECRDMRGLNLLDNLWQDAGYAARQLRAHVGFACTATLMLALGMCASVSIFEYILRARASSSLRYDSACLWCAVQARVEFVDPAITSRRKSRALFVIPICGSNKQRARYSFAS